MNFKTSINLNEITLPQNQIDYQSKNLLLGSCFVENIGNILNNLKFKVFVNPFGVLFHPLAIEKILQDVVNQKVYLSNNLVFDQGLWHSFNHHSEFSGENQHEVLGKINAQNQLTFQFLKNSSHVIITFGTAWVYHHIPTDSLVANCHKIPQNQFLKRILSLQEIENSIETICKLIHQINPSIQIILTLSPVRHLKDGMQNNALSKARLLHGIHSVLNQNNIYYFPAYEILIDDLRDYRFFDKDMIHPSEVAIQYVWELFQNIYFSKKTQNDVAEVQQIIKDLAHKPFHPNSEAHKQFKDRLERKMHEVGKRLGIEL